MWKPAKTIGTLLILTTSLSSVIDVASFTPHASSLMNLRTRSTSKSTLYSTRQDDNKNSGSPIDSNNPITSFFESLNANININFKQMTTSTLVETEEERVIRLKREQLQILDEKEIQRALQVKKDAIPYLFLLALQFLPLLGTERIESIAYFWGVAVATVYVGGRQVTLQESEQVSSENALYAPIGASVSIGLLYLLIKAGFNPAILYAFGVSAFGAISISDIGVPLLRSVLPESFAEMKVEVPEKISKALGSGLEEEGNKLPLDGLTTLILGIGCTAAYWAPTAMEQKFLISNCEWKKWK